MLFERSQVCPVIEGTRSRQPAASVLVAESLVEGSTAMPAQQNGGIGERHPPLRLPAVAKMTALFQRQPMGGAQPPGGDGPVASKPRVPSGLPIMPQARRTPSHLDPSVRPPGRRVVRSPFPTRPVAWPSTSGQGHGRHGFTVQTARCGQEPDVLRGGSPINIALIRAFGVSAEQNGRGQFPAFQAIATSDPHTPGGQQLTSHRTRGYGKGLSHPVPARVRGGRVGLFIVMATSGNTRSSLVNDDRSSCSRPDRIASTATVSIKSA